MAVNLIASMSPKALKRELLRREASDLRPLPAKAKTFAAVANMQSFHEPPEVLPYEDFDPLVREGFLTELNRGLHGSLGIPARIYASALAHGELFPGTQTAFGHGIYFATPGQEMVAAPVPGFSRISAIAKDYAQKGDSGIILRAGLKREAQTLELEELIARQREDRSRALSARILDVGTYAAAIGLDAYYTDKYLRSLDERVWIVVNRTAIIIQADGLLFSGPEIH